MDHVRTIKAIDPDRIVTNSPGYAGELGSFQENRALDYLSPHTTRASDRPWEVAHLEIAMLLARFGKPVADDEPARTGTPQFGRPRGETLPFDRILNTYNVWRAGGHIVYHHDMFQTGYGSPAVPPSGIPDPEFSAFHRPVFEFISRQNRYGQKQRGRMNDSGSLNLTKDSYPSCHGSGWQDPFIRRQNRCSAIVSWDAAFDALLHRYHPRSEEQARRPDCPRNGWKPPAARLTGADI